MNKCVNFLHARRQAEEIKIGPADQRSIISRRGRGEAGALRLARINESMDFRWI